MRAIVIVLLMAAPAWAQTAAPMHSDNITYPRISGLADARAQGAINALLAAHEAQDRAARKDCLAQLRQQHQKPDADTFRESIAVTYLGKRYLSVKVDSGYYCGGPYPTNDNAAPLVVDLRDAKAVDFRSLFKPGFLPKDNGASGLMRLYQARYAAMDEDPDCKNSVHDGGFPLILQLDAKQGGLVVTPEFPHVIEACAEEIVFTPRELAPYAQPELLADMKAVTRK